MNKNHQKINKNKINNNNRNKKIKKISYETQFNLYNIFFPVISYNIFILKGIGIF